MPKQGVEQLAAHNQFLIRSNEFPNQVLVTGFALESHFCRIPMQLHVRSRPISLVPGHRRDCELIEPSRL